MSHEIDLDTHYQEGESLVWTFQTELTDGSTKPLTGGDVEWWLFPQKMADDGDALLTPSDSGVTLSITDAATGEIQLSIDRGATDGMAGFRWHRLRVDDSDKGRQIYTGFFPIDDS